MKTISLMSLLCLVASTSLNSFVTQHFTDNPIWVIFSENIPNENLSFAQTKILFDLSKPLEEFGNKYVHQWVNYLIFLDNATNLADLIQKLTSIQNYNTKQKHLLVIEQESNSKEYFKILWQHDIYNVVILVRNTTTITTWYPYNKKSNCGNTIMVKKAGVVPFNKKIPKTFKNCPVKLIWKNFLFMTTNPNAKMLGAINQMLLLIGKKIGLQMNFEINENVLVNEEHLNRTQNLRLTKYIMENKIDVVSNIYGPSIAIFIDNRLEMSLPISLFVDMWLLPAKHPIPIIEAFISALTLQEYLLIATSFIVFTCVWRFTSKNLFNVVRIFLQQPTFHVNSNPQKLLLIFGLFFTIHIGYLYSSQLLRVLYRPVYPPSYKTLEEVLEKTDLKFHYPLYASAIQKSKNEILWKMIEKRKIADVVERVYSDLEERKRHFFSLDEVLEIGSYDLYYVHNPQDLEILEEQVRSELIFKYENK